MSLHLVIALSSHGFGHIGQTAPVVHALKRRMPSLRITLRTAAPHAKLAERFGRDVEIQTAEVDIGMRQVNALEVSLEESAQAYAAFHRDWEARVAREAQALQALNADLLLANIPYLALAGAARAGIPALALCSLNWAQVYRFYFCGREDKDGGIVDEMLAAYNSAACFMQPEPSIPMPGIVNARPIGPTAQLGINRRAELARQLELASGERLVLVSLGGIDHRLPIERWPELPNTRLLVPRLWQAAHPQAVALETLGMPFIDLLSSCDALITKTGYGSFVEAACSGVPALYLARKNWVETAVLAPWLEAHGRCLAIAPARMDCGDILAPLEALLARSAPRRVEPAGIEEAVDEIVALLRPGSQSS